MSFLSKIVPFYGAIESVVNAIGGTLREDQKRRTMRTEADIEAYLRSETARLQEVERTAEHARHLEKEQHRWALDDRAAEREHQRQLAFEKHRVDLFERIKKTEFEIHQLIQAFDVKQQKEIREWQRDFMQRLEDEAQRVMTERLPKMLATAAQFGDQPIVYENMIQRVFEVADNITVSIVTDQNHFRDDLKELARRPGKLTDSLIELNKTLQIGTLPTSAQLPNKE